MPRPSLPSFVFLSCYFWNNTLLSLHNSTHRGCIRTMLIAGLLGALYVYITYACIWLFLVLCFLSFCCFLCRPPLVAASPVRQLLCNLLLEKCLANWEGKYSSFVGLELSV